MSITHIALLRGINVGKAKRVAMADLRKLMEELGYGDVKTLLNSGNVLFASRDASSVEIARQIEVGMRTQLAVNSRVFVLTTQELEVVVDQNPLETVAADPARFLVGFLAEPAQRIALEPLLEQDWMPEAFAVGDYAAYLWCSEGILASRLMTAVGQAIGSAITTRNWTTVLKLLALVRSCRG